MQQHKKQYLVADPKEKTLTTNSESKLGLTNFEHRHWQIAVLASGLTRKYVFERSILRKNLRRERIAATSILLNICYRVAIVHCGIFGGALPYDAPAKTESLQRNKSNEIKVQ